MRQRFETLRCVTYVRSPVKVLGKNRLELALLCARVPSLLHSLANWPREEAGTTTSFSSLHRTMDKYIGKDGSLLPLLTVAGLARPAEREVAASILGTALTLRFLH